MKKLLFSLVVLFFLNPAQAVMIDLETDLPGSVLFNFQAAFDEEQALTDVLPYDSTLGASYQISAASALFNGAMATPFLDGPVAVDRFGGLGVCKTADCSSSNDDHLDMGESVLLTYTGISGILIGNIHFLSGSHEKVFPGGGQFGISVNGAPTLLFDLVDTFSGLANVALASGDTLEFFWGGDVSQQCILNLTDECSKGIGEDYYVAGWGVVPVPAALPLFLSGLFGFAFFSRRKKAAAAA